MNPLKQKTSKAGAFRAVVAREQGSITGSSNVEEFRNDAFGNVVRKLNRRSAGLINNAPFAMSYSIKGELTSSSALLKTPPESQYQRQDDLGQTFLNGEMIKQGEVIRNPTSGDYDYQLATRNYYSAEDRLMAVQKYSWRPAGVRDGTWEEYRYDALGRRIMTRARRDTTGSYPASTSGPLCQSATIPICRSFVEMVWWDGDQALLENRTAEGRSDVSNSGAVGNVHGLTLDEPLAVYTTNPFTEARIINYNWRGQGLSSVYTNGGGADLVTGNATADIDWPSITQAQTYFTPSLDAPANDNQPKKWMGTFVQNGQGTTGMLYRRNRYFDPNTGRFTQEDPIGIAGGVNAYGFAAGDPVNFSDPFGLCPPRDKNTGDCSWMHEPGLQGPGLADPFLLLGGIEADETAVLANEVEAAADGAYELAVSGGRHSGMIRNYLGKSAAELNHGIASYEKNVAEHLDWIQNPTIKVPDFFSRQSEYQAGLLNKWKTDAIRNASAANILRGLLKEIK